VSCIRIGEEIVVRFTRNFYEIGIGKAARQNIRVLAMRPSG
jgi:hypothetical protein